MRRFATPRRPRRAVALSLGVVLTAFSIRAGAAAEEAPRFDPYFIGYETEPGMASSARFVSSLERAASRGFATLAPAHPGLAPVWEIPLSVVLFLANHEIAGHGGRAREFGLGASYRFHWDLSAETFTSRLPRDHVEGIELSAGGIEASSVLAHRLVLDSLRTDGAEGASGALLLVSKLDLTSYFAQVASPSKTADFDRQYRQGYDPVLYLAERQAERVGAPVEEFWNGGYAIDFSDPRLRRDFDDLRIAAIWNALDPAAIGAIWSYFADHVANGEARLHPRVLSLGGGLALSAGTRAILTPQSISRVLDLHLRTPRALVTVSIRDLKGSVDRTWGFGASLHGLAVGPLRVHLEADSWREPRGEEQFEPRRASWNVGGDLDWRVSHAVGLSVRAGTKSKGVLPGLPVDSGSYFGFGVLVFR